jgi:glyoxylase-like metal-dependent hydrolase (beta-lactamase superfamily II)
VTGTDIPAIATPGHSPGSTCRYLPEAGELFTGDTLFTRGPGATSRSFSDFPTIIGSIRNTLSILPAETTVHTRHGDGDGDGDGDGATISTESPHLKKRIKHGN